MQDIQPLFPLPSEYSESILCFYANVTSQIQIARITNIPDWEFERIIFPGQRLLFESVLEAQLQIYTCMMGNTIFLNKINCNHLRVMKESAVWN
jgi:3-hydroxymyristoyl/3-hydroxydecanoyl-(acyl carrier protein) dehydratase